MHQKALKLPVLCTSSLHGGSMASYTERGVVCRRSGSEGESPIGSMQTGEEQRQQGEAAGTCACSIAAQGCLACVHQYVEGRAVVKAVPEPEHLQSW